MRSVPRGSVVRLGGGNVLHMQTGGIFFTTSAGAKSGQLSFAETVEALHCGNMLQHVNLIMWKMKDKILPYLD